ncbi:MAG: hypothetical protein HY773_02970 [Candidatus Terrybacteria bacterium]|nr:hypothetical protein [Candidatus Terrybacteria bacterium]
MKINFDSKFFQKIKADKKIISKYFSSALKDFGIASKNNYPEVIFNFSYSALLKTGITLIAYHGQRIKSRKGHHIKILEKLSQILDDKNIEIIGDKMRKKRNLDLYEGGIMISKKEMGYYFDFIKAVIHKADKYLKSQKSLF